MFSTKRTWSKCTDARVNDLYKKVVEVAKKKYPSYFEGCEPEFWLDTSTSHIGRCITSYTKKYTSERELIRDYNTNSIRYDRGVILLSKYAITMSDSNILNTLCHEFGHYVTPHEHHSYLWQKRADSIGSEFGQNCERLASAEESSDFAAQKKAAGIVKTKRYIVGCPNCTNRWRRARRTELIIHPEFYRCPACKVTLINMTENN